MNREMNFKQMKTPRLLNLSKAKSKKVLSNTLPIHTRKSLEPRKEPQPWFSLIQWLGTFLVVFIFFSEVVLRGNFSLTFWFTYSSLQSLILQIIANLWNDTFCYMNRFQCLEEYWPVYLSLHMFSVIFIPNYTKSENYLKVISGSTKFKFRFKKRVWYYLR